MFVDHRLKATLTALFQAQTALQSLQEMSYLPRQSDLSESHEILGLSGGMNCFLTFFLDG